MNVQYVSWDGLFDQARCEETTGFNETANDYARCGGVAVAVVLSERGRRLHFMCLDCAYHNVKNRGVKLVATTDKALAKAVA